MSNYCIKSDSTKRVKKYLTKFGELKIDTDKIRGKILITGYRKYNFYEEIDLTFQGEIYARVNFKKSEWYSSDILDGKNFRVSKIKVNRLIKRCLFKDLSRYLNYFSISIHNHCDIKKINWL